MAKGGDIASKTAGERGQRGGVCLQRKPRYECARGGGPAGAAGGENVLLAQAIEVADVSDDLSDLGRAAAVRVGFQYGSDKVLLAYDP